MPTTAGDPSTPLIMAIFVLSFAGTAYTLFSRNARVKRVVLPVSLVVFSVVGFVFIRRSDALPQISDLLLVALLALNAIYTMRVIRFCPTCGRTVQQSLFKPQDGPCPACVTASAAANTV